MPPVKIEDPPEPRTFEYCWSTISWTLLVFSLLATIAVKIWISI